MLLAELEHLHHTVKPQQGVKDKDADAKVRRMQEEGGKGSNKGKGNVCSFWGSETGRRRGKACTYEHDWQSLQDKDKRRYVCSGRNHTARECPTYEKKTEEGATNDKDKGAKGKGKSKSKGKSTTPEKF